MKVNFYKSMIKSALFIGLFCIPFFLLCSSTAIAQNNTVSGTVTDSQTGETLPGVNILVVGTSTGTATNAKGHYSLSVSSLQDSLRFSFIGYKSQTVPINGRTTINIKLKSAVIGGNQLVVIGYGTQQKKDVTGSVGSVEMQSIENAPITAANQALEGQISGVHVNTTNGIPGGGPQIQIRGVGSIGAGNNPLYVVNGYPLPTSATQISNPLNNIPASSIKSISVLKGPSAGAIYGSRAANGVILITTKQGKQGAFRFGVNAYNGWQVIGNQQKPDMANAQQFAAFEKQAYENRGEAVPKEYQNPSQYGVGTDWFDAMTRVAPQRKIEMSASGGNKHITAYVSGGYLSQKGVVLGTGYNRFNVTTRINANITPRLHMKLMLNPTYSYGSHNATGGNERFSNFGHWEVLSPLVPVRAEDGSLNKYICGPGLLCFQSPVFALKNITNRQHETYVLSHGSMSYNLTNYLTIKATGGFIFDNANTYIFSPSTVGSRGTPPPVIPSGSFAQAKNINWINEDSFTFDHTFNGSHHIKLLGDFSVQRAVGNTANFNGSQFPDNTVKTLNAAGKVTVGVGTGESSWSLLSYLGRLNYSYKERYLLTASVRRDGSSKFGPNRRWGVFPSVAVGWNITNEPWLENMSWLSNLKIRGSWGLTGNDEIGNFAYTSSIGGANYILAGSSLASGRTINGLGNPSLAWEKTKEIDIGLNIGFVNNRIKLEADLYRSRTSNLLLNLQIPPSSGFTSVIRNIGEVQNKGIEIDLHTVDFSKQNFQWNTSFKFSLNRNKTLALGPTRSAIRAGHTGYTEYSNITEVGKPVGMLYGLKFLGLYTKEQLNNPKIPKYPGAVPGDMRILDGNGDGKLTAPDDKVIIGNPYPKFQYGITSTLNYKNLSFSFIVSGRYGGKKYKYASESVRNIDGVFDVIADYYKHMYISPQEPGDGRHPLAAQTTSDFFYRDINSLDIFNASYLWVKNINLSYTFPNSLVKGRVRSLTIYGNIQNAFMITPYPYGNPATTNYTGHGGSGGALGPGVDANSYPVPRVYSIGIRLNL
jgi:TonB-linked SusC/RagA family outer membrane protein